MKTLLLVSGGDGQLAQALRYIAENELYITSLDYLYVDALPATEKELTQRYEEKLATLSPNGILICGYAHKAFDVTNPDTIEFVLASGVACRSITCCVQLLNTASYTAVDKAEVEVEKAEAVNCKGVDNIVKVAIRYLIPVIHISTDFVFGPYHSSPINEREHAEPLSVYGRTKYQGELQLSYMQQLHKALVVRTAWLYSPFANNFLKTIASKLKEGTPLRVVNDQWGNPTYALDLANALLKIIEIYAKELRYRTPLLHYSGEGLTSWFLFAEAIRNAMSLQSVQLTPITTEQYGAPAPRPPYSALDKGRVYEIYNLTPAAWDAGIVPSLQMLGLL